MAIWDQLKDQAQDLIQQQQGKQQQVQGASERPKTPDRPPNSATPEPVDVPQQSAVTAQDNQWNFDRLKSALDGGDRKERSVQAAHSQARQETAETEKKAGILGKLGDILQDDEEGNLRLQLTKLDAEEGTLRSLEKQQEESRDIGDKLKEKLRGPDPAYEKEKERIRAEKERISLARESIEKQLAQKRADPDWRDKLQSQVLGQNEELDMMRKKQAALRAEKQGNNVFDKFKDKLDGETEEEKKIRLQIEQLEAEQKKSVGWQVKDFLGKNPQENPTTSDGFNLKDKLNEAAGGGRAGEAQEDKFDKVVDLFQQHVLKEGDQSNESALEQKKDDAIAVGIRNAFQTVSGKQ